MIDIKHTCRNNQVQWHSIRMEELRTMTMTLMMSQWCQEMTSSVTWRTWKTMMAVTLHPRSPSPVMHLSHASLLHSTLLPFISSLAPKRPSQNHHVIPSRSCHVHTYSSQLHSRANEANKTRHQGLTAIMDIFSTFRCTLAMVRSTWVRVEGLAKHLKATMSFLCH